MFGRILELNLGVISPSIQLQATVFLMMPLGLRKQNHFSIDK